VKSHPLSQSLEVSVRFPSLCCQLYESPYEAQLWAVFDAHKRLVTFGDYYPSAQRLPAGEYEVRLQVRHSKVELLQKLRHMPMMLHLTLAAPVKLSPVAGDVSRWVQDAETLHPNVRSAQSSLEIARLEVTKAQAGHRPTLDATASQSITRTPSGTAANAATSRVTATVIGLNFNLPLFAGYATENRIRETLALDDKARSDLEGAKRTAAQATRPHRRRRRRRGRRRRCRRRRRRRLPPLIVACVGLV
jgi:hypothetical protein